MNAKPEAASFLMPLFAVRWLRLLGHLRALSEDLCADLSGPSQNERGNRKGQKPYIAYVHRSALDAVFFAALILRQSFFKVSAWL